MVRHIHSCDVAHIVPARPHLSDGRSGLWDVRAVAFGFCDQLETIYFGLATADKPTHMTVSRRDSSSASTLRTTFTIAFDTEITAQSLVSE